MAEGNKAWAQFVCTTDNESEPILIVHNKFVIGRSKTGSDLCFEGNKLVSTAHCIIERDHFGKVWLQDTSTNGTFINLSKIVHSRVELKHGDEVHIVYKSEDAEDNIGYLFQDLEQLQEEENEGADSSDPEMTQEYSLEHSDTLDERPSRKRELQQTADSSESTEYTSPAGKRVRVDGKSTVTETSAAGEATAHLTSVLAETSDCKTAVDDNETTSNTKQAGTSHDKDAFEWSLTCIICQEILHDCVSLQPCMHSFCAGCYSGWMLRSRKCPSCRMKVDRINRNHIVNNLAEAYLTEHPEKKRSEEDVKELNEKNKITKDMLYPSRSSQEGNTSSEYSDSDEGTPADSEDTPTSLCRQCAGYRGDPSSVCAMTSGVVSVGATPDLALVAAARNDKTVMKRMPAVPAYSCTPQQDHIACLCCFERMPDRRNDTNGSPPQHCSLCLDIYCHMYWGCKNIHCFGCLSKFKDVNVGLHSLPVLLLGNTYESNILKSYLESKTMTISDLLQECCNRLNRSYTWDGTVINLTGDSIVCYRCALLHFSRLAYQYRAAIPVSELPAAVSQRRDCYWGRNCRSQNTRPHHAANFNHICEQTRTT